MDPFKITLEAARVNVHLTQDEAAKQMHVSKQTIVNWEKGRSEPTISQALKLCELYRIPIEHVNFGEKTI